jgi:hypothetical protein
MPDTRDNILGFDADRLMKFSIFNFHWGELSRQKKSHRENILSPSTPSNFVDIYTKETQKKRSKKPISDYRKGKYTEGGGGEECWEDKLWLKVKGGNDGDETKAKSRKNNRAESHVFNYFAYMYELI